MREKDTDIQIEGVPLLKYYTEHLRDNYWTGIKDDIQSVLESMPLERGLSITVSTSGKKIGWKIREGKDKWKLFRSRRYFLRSVDLIIAFADKLPHSLVFLITSDRRVPDGNYFRSASYYAFVTRREFLWLIWLYRRRFRLLESIILIELCERTNKSSDT